MKKPNLLKAICIFIVFSIIFPFCIASNFISSIQYEKYGIEVAARITETRISKSDIDSDATIRLTVEYTYNGETYTSSVKSKNGQVGSLITVKILPKYPSIAYLKQDPFEKYFFIIAAIATLFGGTINLIMTIRKTRDYNNSIKFENSLLR